jgi:hypothetical protein
MTDSRPFWDFFRNVTFAESPRDCPPGSLYVDTVDDGVVRIQVIGGPDDGYTTYGVDKS